MNRRSFLKRSSLVSVGAVGVAGCTGVGSPSEATFVVDYFGSWHGSVGTAGGSRSISGRGSQRYTIDEPDIVSGNAQKRDDSTSRLTVAIRADGDVVARSSTASAYGVAQVSHSF